MKKLISIIVPVYNEESNLKSFYQELKASLPAGFDFEIIFVDDGSKDKTKEIIKALCVKDKRIKTISFTRNFGKEAATTAGLHSSRGDAAIVIDCDLQHPPKLIPKFISKWEAGTPVVVGVRKNHSGKGLIKKIGSSLFYKIINRISDTKMIPNSTDFRLLDKRVVKEFNRLAEHNRISRGLVDWLGFDQEVIYFYSLERNEGEASYNTLKLFKLAFNSMVSLSLFPLRLAGYLGIFITLLSAILGIIVFIAKYILKNTWGSSISGSGLLALMLMFLIGIVLITLGLIALYIANIHEETIGRPLYVVKEDNFNKDDE